MSLVNRQVARALGVFIALALLVPLMSPMGAANSPHVAFGMTCCGAPETATADVRAGAPDGEFSSAGLCVAMCAGALAAGSVPARVDLRQAILIAPGSPLADRSDPPDPFPPKTAAKSTER